MQHGKLRQHTKCARSWMSLGDTYVTNNGGFLRHGISPVVVSLRRLVPPLNKHRPPVAERDFYVVCSRLESYHGCLSVISTADLACVFHNASLVNVLQEPSKNSRSVAPLTSSNQHLEQTDLAEQPQTDRSCEDGPLCLPRAVLLLPWQLLPVVGYGFCV